MSEQQTALDAVNRMESTVNAIVAAERDPTDDEVKAIVADFFTIARGLVKAAIAPSYFIGGPVAEQ